MSSKETKEWFLDAPWGKLAMVSWGQTSNPPVLLVHGYMDTAATFIPLVKQLPDTYYYVAVDLPGHGLSDPFPVGILPSTIHLVEVIGIVVRGLNWEKFIYIGHSMAVIIGAYYYTVYPNQISKMISLDPLLALSMCYMSNKLKILNYWYGHYYNNYLRYNTKNPTTYTHEQAVDALVRSRNLTEKQAEVILSRALIPAGGGKYRLSWDSKMKNITNITISKETLCQVLIMNAPPTLCLYPTEDSSVEHGRKWAHEIISKVHDTTPNYFTVFVTGGHNIHITNSGEVASHVTEFLKKRFVVHVESKL